MEVNFSGKTYRITNNKSAEAKTVETKPQPSFKGSQGLTPEQAEALKAQHIASQNISNKSQVPNIEEKDINLQATCVGCSNANNNTREIIDFRIAMASAFGYEWSSNFYVPHIVRNKNGDERYNGETTAIAIPLAPDTPGIRGGDSAVIMFNGNLDPATVNELVEYMIQTKILKKATYGTAQKQWCHLNSDNPKRFFDNSNIRTVLANFFRKKANEQQKAQQEPQVPLKESDINIRNYREQDKNNTRDVKDYRNAFLKNNKKLTIGHSTYEENGVKKPMTVILIPTKEDVEDCIAITIDNRKLSKQQCNDLMNYLKYNNITNSEDEMFKKAVVNYLNS